MRRVAKLAGKGWTAEEGDSGAASRTSWPHSWLYGAWYEFDTAALAGFLIGLDSVAHSCLLLRMCVVARGSIQDSVAFPGLFQYKQWICGASFTRLAMHEYNGSCMAALLGWWTTQGFELPCRIQNSVALGGLLLCRFVLKVHGAVGAGNLVLLSAQQFVECDPAVSGAMVDIRATRGFLSSGLPRLAVHGSCKGFISIGSPAWWVATELWTT